MTITDVELNVQLLFVCSPHDHDEVSTEQTISANVCAGKMFATTMSFALNIVFSCISLMRFTHCVKRNS